jgi:bacteriophage N4 adsorption protein B
MTQTVNSGLKREPAQSENKKSPPEQMVMIKEVVGSALAFAQHECVLYAAFGIALSGIDDLAVDMLWVGRTMWKRAIVGTQHKRATTAQLVPPDTPGFMAVFIPAWDETAVISAMLHHSIKQWQAHNVRFYVGCYPNDDATFEAIRSVKSPLIHIAICDTPGPTTKADCLNNIWRVMLRDEIKLGVTAKAIILHDAEDVVHPKELAVFDALIDRFALVQLPVLPLLNVKSRWVSGHYADEFCEAHAKDLVVRGAIGARIPLAGVGCAIRRDTLQEIASTNGGKPFDSASLTEDYELGLKLTSARPRSTFVRMRDADTGELVAVRAYFPATFDAAIRQKARWVFGIALAGWDRLGWAGNIFEFWMRLRDRRTLLTATILTAAYSALALSFLLWLLALPFHALAPGIATLLTANASLLAWRACMRMAFVGHQYGWKEGLRAGPRMVISNIIAILATRRAVFQYVAFLRSGKTQWDKTSHIFPDASSK